VRPARGGGLGPAGSAAPARSPMADQIDEAEQGVLQRSVAPFEASGITVVGKVEQGQPGPRLCRLAAEEGVDLLVIGSRGHTEIKALILGSVSDAVVHGAPCPVLVVH
jgi:nucleotide-binding universal stress UspA family protein